MVTLSQSDDASANKGQAERRRARSEFDITLVIDG